jgi:hypothetical protein
MTPPRPQMWRPSSDRALAVQDPYTLSPSDQSRYESVFSQYAKEDGFVYGKEAVDLFSKSGLPQPLLAAIWNMVDTPVDNRLDKLEFAMGMHLIVCISKKGLPMPPSLPVSLGLLKSQQSAAMHPNQPTSPGSVAADPQRAMQLPPPPMQLGGRESSTGSVSAMPDPQMQMQQAPPIQPSLSMTGSFQGSAPPIQPSMSMTGSFQGSAPPLQQQGGGMSISDAFEGLTPVDAGPSYLNAAPPVPSSVTFENSTPHAQEPVAAPAPAPAMQLQPAPTPAPAYTPSPEYTPAPEPPKTTEQLASSYNMGGANEELDKLKGILQKLQAENISLKAQLGTMSSEEMDVQRDLSATVVEIGNLSNELTGMRAQVLAAKSRLLEATSELKSAKEKKG